MSLPCSQPGKFEGYLHKCFETGKLPNGLSEILTKTYHFCGFSYFFNPRSLPCSQPNKFDGYLHKPSETGSAPNGSSEILTKLKPTFFKLFPLFQPDEPTLQPARPVRRLLVHLSETGKLPNGSFEILTKAYHLCDFFNPMSVPCSQPGKFEGYLHKRFETGKLPNGSSKIATKTYHVCDVSTFSI